MVRFIISILLVTIFSNTWAQQDLAPRCPYDGTLGQSSRDIRTAPDFTITTTDGITRNLYTTLDSGITVFVDLFYTTCHYCQVYAPVIEEVYQNTGAGSEDIQFWGISNNLFDTNSVIDRYKLNYNVSNPCAGPWGGGTTAFSIIVEGQEFYGFPTYCVICPDRRMFFGVCYPPDTTCFNPFFEQCAENVGTDENTGMPSPVIFSPVYPNPATDQFTVDIYLAEPGKQTFEIIDFLGRKHKSVEYELKKGNHSLTLSADKLPRGIYFVKMLQNGQLAGIQKISIVGH
jgi:thiol-disulfide isomerase/thioredoxin